MSFRHFAEPPIPSLIAEAAESERVTLIVGAGASMEAGLPSWEQLISRLLERVARQESLVDLDDSAQVERWNAEAIRDGYLASAAIIDAFAGARRDSWIASDLFKGSDRATFIPGAIARQIPRLRAAYADGLRILTMNYDDLIEQAFREDGRLKPVPLTRGDAPVPSGAVGVVHLHGYLGRDGVESPLVLSEADYQAMQQGEPWQEELVGRSLGDSTVLFVGTSLVDPNLIRYLYSVDRKDAPPAYAIFVRQGTYPADISPAIPKARERALRARWGALGVTPVFVDHYVDVAQLLFEVYWARERRSSYVSLPERARAWTETIDRDLLGLHDAGKFVRSQEILNRTMNEVLGEAQAAASDAQGGRWDEKLGLTMWLIDADGATLTNRAATDRIHVDLETVEPVLIHEHAPWLAVRSYCRGTPLAENRDIYASRWKFIRSTPLVVESELHGRLPVGCLTTTSMKGKADTMLDGMRGEVVARFNRTLHNGALTLLGASSSEG